MQSSKTPFDGQISYALAAAHRTMNQNMTKRLKRHGVQIEAWRIMECLDATERLTMGELARMVLMNPPTLSKMVDRMVSDGLVHRQIAHEDQRQVNLLLTDLGRSRMLTVRREVDRHDEEFVNQMNESDNRLLIDLLTKLAK